MFLLRIAEALVSGEESQLNAFNNNTHDETDESGTNGSQMNIEAKSPEISSLQSAPQSPDTSSTNQSAFENEMQTTQSTGQGHQGLLYNLLIAQEAAAPVIVNNKKSALKKNIGTSRSSLESISSRISDGHFDSSCSILSSLVNSCDSDNNANSKNVLAYNHIRNRASSFGCKPANNRPFTRPHAFSVGANSDFYPSLKARLQHRRQTEIASSDLGFFRSKGSLYHKTLSKSHEHSMNSTSCTDSRSYALSSVLPQTTSLSSSGISSPRTYQLSLSAQARLTAPSSNIETPHSSSGFCSATLRQSPLTSSLSNDSGSEEPIDLTGYNLSTSPIISINYLPESTFDDLINKKSNSFCVQLAKKTARPVQARITEWLRQVTEFVALSTPLIITLKPKMMTLNGLSKDTNGLHDKNNMNTWLSLLGRCWHKLLALSMVEHGLDVVVVEDKSSYDENSDCQDVFSFGIPWSLLTDVHKNGIAAAFTKHKRPDRKFANELLQFISEIRQAGLTTQEFYLLRHVILLTADEPETIPTLGLNVIRASRCKRFETEPKATVANFLKSGTSISTEDLEPPTVTFDLACLACGLKALKSMCPYRIANLFCGHLLNGSMLNQEFVCEMHEKYLSAVKDLQELFSNTHLSNETNKHSQ